MPSWSFSEAPWYKMPWDGGDSKCWPRHWQPHMWFIYPLASVKLQGALPGEQGWNPLHQDHFVTISAVWQWQERLPPQREASNVLARGLHMLSHKFEHIFQKFTWSFLFVLLQSQTQFSVISCCLVVFHILSWQEVIASSMTRPETLNWNWQFRSHSAVDQCWGWDAPTVKGDVFCLDWSLTQSLSFWNIKEPGNLQTQTQGLCMFAHGARRLGSESPWKWWAGEGQDSSMNIWGQFHHLKKPNFSSLWHAPPPGGLLLSTLAPKWAASTLTCVLNIVSQYQIYTFHIKISLQHGSVQCFRSHHAQCIYLQQGLYGCELSLTWAWILCYFPWSASPCSCKCIL